MIGDDKIIIIIMYNRESKCVCLSRTFVSLNEYVIQKDEIGE